MTLTPTRRDVLKFGAAGAAGVAAGSLLPPALLEALANPPHCGSLADIEHVVFFIQENRSFDHYFGRYPGVRGFDDRSVRLFTGDDGTAVFKQANTGNGSNPLMPFHVNTTDAGTTGECTHDIGHQWVEQHSCWNNGQMDSFVSTHVATEGAAIGPLTMAYYDRRDLPFYWALADNFTLCDNYFTSAISGTLANRILGLTGTVDPAGVAGGPVVNTPEGTNQADYTKLLQALSWRTYPEVLQDAGISWKFYNPEPVDLIAPPLNDNPMVFFKQYATNPNLALNAFGSTALTYPANFIADCASGNLPAVSWVYTPFLETEHPPTPLLWGEFAVGQAIQALAANPGLWSKTAMFITWDDSGGFFDHVPPPTAPSGTPGEYLTASPPVGGNGGINGPIGLGFRVPMIVVSPFSRNPKATTDPGWQPLVCSDLFDHTSHMRFVKSLFVAKGRSATSVDLPNDTVWRRSQAGGTGVGDMTSALNLVKVNGTFPSLPYRSATDFAAVLAKQECATALATEVPGDPVPGYPIPTTTTLPTQDTGTKTSPSGVVACTPTTATSPDLLTAVTTLVTNLVNTLVAVLQGALGGALGAGLWFAARAEENQAPAPAAEAPVVPATGVAEEAIATPQRDSTST